MDNFETKHDQLKLLLAIADSYHDFGYSKNGDEGGRCYGEGYGIQNEQNLTYLMRDIITDKTTINPVINYILKPVTNYNFLAKLKKKDKAFLEAIRFLNRDSCSSSYEDRIMSFIEYNIQQLKNNDQENKQVTAYNWNTANDSKAWVHFISRDLAEVRKKINAFFRGISEDEIDNVFDTRPINLIIDATSVPIGNICNRYDPTNTTNMPIYNISCIATQYDEASKPGHCLISVEYGIEHNETIERNFENIIIGNDVLPATQVHFQLPCICENHRWVTEDKNSVLLGSSCSQSLRWNALSVDKTVPNLCANIHDTDNKSDLGLWKLKKPDNFKAMIYDIKRSLDYGQVAFVEKMNSLKNQVKAVHWHVYKYRNLKKDIFDVHNTTDNSAINVLVTFDRLCFMRARLIGVPTIFSVGADKYFLYKGMVSTEVAHQNLIDVYANRIKTILNIPIDSGLTSTTDGLWLLLNNKINVFLQSLEGIVAEIQSTTLFDIEESSMFFESIHPTFNSIKRMLNTYGKAFLHQLLKEGTYRLLSIFDSLNANEEVLASVDVIKFFKFLVDLPGNVPNDDNTQSFDQFKILLQKLEDIFIEEVPEQFQFEWNDFTPNPRANVSSPVIANTYSYKKPQDISYSVTHTKIFDFHHFEYLQLILEYFYPNYIIKDSVEEILTEYNARVRKPHIVFGLPTRDMVSEFFSSFGIVTNDRAFKSQINSLNRLDILSFSAFKFYYNELVSLKLVSNYESFNKYFVVNPVVKRSYDGILEFVKLDNESDIPYISNEKQQEILIRQHNNKTSREKGSSSLSPSKRAIAPIQRVHSKRSKSGQSGGTNEDSSIMLNSDVDSLIDSLHQLSTPHNTEIFANVQNDSLQDKISTIDKVIDKVRKETIENFNTSFPDVISRIFNRAVTLFLDPEWETSEAESIQLIGISSSLYMIIYAVYVWIAHSSEPNTDQITLLQQLLNIHTILFSDTRFLESKFDVINCLLDWKDLNSDALDNLNKFLSTYVDQKRPSATVTKQANENLRTLIKKALEISETGHKVKIEIKQDNSIINTIYLQLDSPSTIDPFAVLDSFDMYSVQFIEYVINLLKDWMCLVSLEDENEGDSTKGFTITSETSNVEDYDDEKALLTIFDYTYNISRDTTEYIEQLAEWLDAILNPIDITATGHITSMQDGEGKSEPGVEPGSSQGPVLGSQVPHQFVMGTLDPTQPDLYDGRHGGRTLVKYHRKYYSPYLKYYNTIL